MSLLIGKLKIRRKKGITITKLKKLQIIDGTLSSNLTTGPSRPSIWEPVILDTQTVIDRLNGSVKRTVNRSIYNAFATSGKKLNRVVGAVAGNYLVLVKMLPIETAPLPSRRIELG